MVDFGVSKAKARALSERMLSLGMREQDIEETFTAGAGKGGQKINKTANRVFIRHVPTGTTVRCQRERELSVNRFLARRLLADKLEELQGGSVRNKDVAARKKRKQKARRRRRSKAKYKTEKKINFSL